MAYSFTVNTTPATGGIAIYSLVAKLLAVGWLQKGSGDGTTYSNSAAGPVANGNTGATGLNNTSAWVRLQMPAVGGVTREMILQRGADSIHWRGKYSLSAGFTGGSPSATQTPSATDEVYMPVIGGGTDASPTYTGYLGTDNTYRCNVVAQDAAPYGFCFFTFGTGGTSTSRVGLMLDPVLNPSASDPDPYVWYVSTGGAAAWDGTGDLGGDASASPPPIKGYLSTTISSANFVGLAAVQPFAGNAAGRLVRALGTSPFDSTDPILPLYWARRIAMTAPVGFKGQSTFLYWDGVIRSIGDTLSIASPGAKDRITNGEVCTIWNGSVPTV